MTSTASAKHPLRKDVMRSMLKTCYDEAKQRKMKCINGQGKDEEIVFVFNKTRCKTVVPMELFMGDLVEDYQKYETRAVFIYYSNSEKGNISIRTGDDIRCVALDRIIQLCHFCM